jgi:hypothetical protein
MQAKKERVSFARRRKKHTLLRSSTTRRISSAESRIDSVYPPLNFVIVDDELLLQDLDSIKRTRLLLFRQHDFTEIAFAEHCQEIEVVKTNLPFRFVLGWASGRLTLLKWQLCLGSGQRAEALRRLPLGCWQNREPRINMCLGWVRMVRLR